MHNYTREDILKMVEEEDVGFIRLQFTDIYGTIKNMAVTVSQLEKALDNRCVFDGSSVEGFAELGESDMYLYPDLNTFEIFPWRPQQGKVARMICDVHYPDGRPFELDPRYILKKVVKEAEEMGYTLKASPECEFFLFHTDEDGIPTTITHEQGSSFDVGPLDLGENARRDMVLTLEDMGFNVETSHHELAPAQHEIFRDDTDKNGMSQEGYQFMGGILEHIKAITCITNPTVNSYKRFVPGYEAPVYITWSGKSRSPLIRIPAMRGEHTRLELRSPDPSANPYLALAVLLAAGLDGIKNSIKPIGSIDLNAQKMTDEQRASLHIDMLPQSLPEAVNELEQDSFIKDVLGRELSTKMIDSHKKAYHEYCMQVTDWEIANYLHKI